MHCLYVLLKINFFFYYKKVGRNYNQAPCSYLLISFINSWPILFSLNPTIHHPHLDYFEANPTYHIISSLNISLAYRI